jgi:hypothetical protein
VGVDRVRGFYRHTNRKLWRCGGGHGRRRRAGLHEVLLNSPCRRAVLGRHLPPGRSVCARRTADDRASRARRQSADKRRARRRGLMHDDRARSLNRHANGQFRRGSDRHRH